MNDFLVGSAAAKQSSGEATSILRLIIAQVWYCVAHTTPHKPTFIVCHYYAVFGQAAELGHGGDWAWWEWGAGWGPGPKGEVSVGTVDGIG